jgi:ketosteroid isomerase-like protein
MSAVSTSIADNYVRSINRGDAAAYISLFAADAVVDDGGREFRGVDAIRKWSESDIFAVHVSLEVLDESQRDGDVVLTTRVDGDFDRTGLPDPVVIVHRLAVEGEKITRLTCRLAE